MTAQIINTFRHAHWTQYLQVPNQVLPAPWRAWVLASGSLTQRLIKASDGDFRVQLIRQEWALPWPSECLALGLATGQQALIREVALICHGVPWVEARTLIPADTLTGPQRRLRSLGETPLGAYLFKCRNMRRGPLQIAPRPNCHARETSAWGRRSLFYLADHPLLVSEFFLPQILGVQNPSERPAPGAH